LSSKVIRGKINSMLRRNLKNNRRLVASKLLFCGRNVLLDSLLAEVRG